MQLALLASLPMRSGEVVSVDRLVDDLGERAAAGRAKTLQVYVSRLRGALGGAGLLRRDGSGYVLRLPSGRSTPTASSSLYNAGREHARCGDSSAAARTLGRRSGSGEARRSPSSQTTRALRPRSRGSRRFALLRSRSGSTPTSSSAAHAALVPELERLVREHPSAGAAARAAHARALPEWTPGGRARRLPAGPPGSARRARARARAGAAGARARDPQPGAALRAPPPRGLFRPRRRQRRGALFAVAGGLLLVAAALAARCSSPRRRADGRDSPRRLRTRLPRSTRARTARGRASDRVRARGRRARRAVDLGRERGRPDDHARRSRDPAGAGQDRPRPHPQPDRLRRRAPSGSRAPVGFRGVVQAVDPAQRLRRLDAGRFGSELDAATMCSRRRPRTRSQPARGASGRTTSTRILALRAGSAWSSRRRWRSSHSVDGIAVGEGAVWVASGADDRVLRLDPRGGASSPRSRSQPRLARASQAPTESPSATAPSG